MGGLNSMRFSVKESYVDGFGECFKLIDSEDEFGEWYSMSEHDLTHLSNFLNNMDYNINNLKEVINGLVKNIKSKDEKILELHETIKKLEKSM